MTRSADHWSTVAEALLLPLASTASELEMHLHLVSDRSPSASMSNKFSLVAALAAVTSFGACANTSGNTSATCSALTATAAKPSPEWQGTVFTIVMENHSYGQIVG